MIDPRTTNIVGTRVRIVNRSNQRITCRGVVRVVDYNQGVFALLIEATETADDLYPSKGELFQVSLFDESIAVTVEDER